MVFYVVEPVFVTDSFGNLGSVVTVPIDAPRNVVTFIGCTLSIMDQMAVVDARTKLLLSADPVAVKTGSKWNIWPVMDQQVQETFDPQIDGVSNAQAHISLIFTPTSSGRK